MRKKPLLRFLSESKKKINLLESIRQNQRTFQGKQYQQLYITLQQAVEDLILNCKIAFFESINQTSKSPWHRLPLAIKHWSHNFATCTIFAPIECTQEGWNKEVLQQFTKFGIGLLGQKDIDCPRPYILICIGRCTRYAICESSSVVRW